MWMVALQVRRTRTSEPDDNVFAIRRWADLQFLIVVLRRLRRAAELADRVPLTAQRMQMAIAIPVLVKMRNVSEHFDDYALDSSKRRHKDVDRRALQVRSIDGSAYEWLGAHWTPVSLLLRLRPCSERPARR